MKLILLALSTIFLSSCFPTQYYTVSAPNSYKNDSSELVLENDTVRVTYNLNGSGGPMRITIFNKTSQTMEVDWSKSSLVMDENVYAFHQPVAYVEGAGVTGNARGGRYSHFNGVISSDDGIQYLPPRASVTRRPLAVLEHRLENLPFDSIPWENHEYGKGNHIKIKKLSYSPDNSPLMFRSYLSLRIGEGKEFNLDHYFYVSEVWTSPGDPSYFLGRMLQAGNVFSD